MPDEAPAAAAPEGTVTWGLHVTLVAKWPDPADTEAFIDQFMVLYAIHEAVVKPTQLFSDWLPRRTGVSEERRVGVACCAP